jgi:hypothetical protein
MSGELSRFLFLFGHSSTDFVEIFENCFEITCKRVQLLSPLEDDQANRTR